MSRDDYGVFNIVFPPNGATQRARVFPPSCINVPDGGPCGPYGNFLTNLNVCKSIIGPGHIINLANDSFYDPLHSEAMH